jgi:hypothetical protein
MRTISVRLLVVVGLIGLGISGSQAFAQNEVLPTSVSGPSGPKIPWPHPFLLAGLGVNGAGYSSISGNVGGGLRIDTTHLIWTASAGYDTARKANDNTVDNVSGHSRSLDSSIYYRFQNGWFAGGGAGWTQLSTTNYSKQAFRPSVGGGKDYFHNQCAAEDCVNEWSMRWQVDYTLKGAEHVDPRGCTVPDGQCTNDLQGPMVSLYLPSPALARHVFWRTTLGIYTFHTTVTSTDPYLTSIQKGQRSVTAVLDFAMMYRF